VPDPARDPARDPAGDAAAALTRSLIAVCRQRGLVESGGTGASLAGEPVRRSPAAMLFDPEAGRREATKIRNRAAILDAARVVFAERGYEAASVRDIIRRTDLASGTFYNYFASKEAIAAALAEDAAERLRPILVAERARARDLPGYLDAVIRAYFRFLVQEHGDASARAPVNKLPQVRISTPAQRAVFEEVRGALAEALGALTPAAAELDMLTAGAIGACRSMGERMLERPCPDADQTAAVAVRLILAGLPEAATPGSAPAVR